MKRIKDFFKKLKDANFEQALIVLIALFLLGVIFISLTTTNTSNTNTTIGNNGGITTSTANNGSVIDPTVLTKYQKNIYYYQYGTVMVDGTVGTYYYQKLPTSDEILSIKKDLGLVTLELVDETYKATKVNDPVVAPVQEPVLDEPRVPGYQVIPDGMSGDGLVD